MNWLETQQIESLIDTLISEPDAAAAFGLASICRQVPSRYRPLVLRLIQSDRSALCTFLSSSPKHLLFPSESVIQAAETCVTLLLDPTNPLAQIALGAALLETPLPNWIPLYRVLWTCPVPSLHALAEQRMSIEIKMRGQQSERSPSASLHNRLGLRRVLRGMKAVTRAPRPESYRLRLSFPNGKGISNHARDIDEFWLACRGLLETLHDWQHLPAPLAREEGSGTGLFTIRSPLLPAMVDFFQASRRSTLAALRSASLPAQAASIRRLASARAAYVLVNALFLPAQPHPASPTEDGIASLEAFLSILSPVTVWLINPARIYLEPTQVFSSASP